MSIFEVSSLDGFAQHVLDNKGRLCVVYFWASFHEACQPGGQMDTVFSHLLAKNGAEASFIKVDAEEFGEIAEKYDVTMVPSFVFLVNGKKVDIVEGAKPPQLVSKMEKCLTQASLPGTITQAGTNIKFANGSDEHLKSLIESSRVMLFMKGNPEKPYCKFSRAMIEILKEANVQFSSFDIFSDETVRQNLKEYSKWPTYPQLYIDGKFVGGLDVIKELKENDELNDLFKPVAVEVKPPLNERLKALIETAPVMLFMKGNRDEPRCGFSSKIVTILNDEQIEYSTFDILSDNEVRQGLKEYSEWPTYPQLYVNGTLVGGLDIVQDMVADGDLKGDLGL